MRIVGIDELTFGVKDLALAQRFFTDWGLNPLSSVEGQLEFETLNGAKVRLIDGTVEGFAPGVEPDPTVREVVWGVADASSFVALKQRLQSKLTYFDHGERVGCSDPSGLRLAFQVSVKKTLNLPVPATNNWSSRARVDQRAPQYERAQPVDIGHVVFFVKDLNATRDFYMETLGFVLSDAYPDRGAFLRCEPRGGHHDLFLLQLPQPRQGLNHVAFTVRDHHEVFGGGMHMSRQGWTTELGPGRHPISSAIFWYFESPAGGLIEYYADEDELTEAWTPRSFTPGPTMFAEWAITGGIDGNTRRQTQAQAPTGQFLTDKPKP